MLFSSLVGMATRSSLISDGTCFDISYPSLDKKYILIFKFNGYQIFVSSSSSLGNGHIPIPVITFLLFQSQLIDFYKIIKNYGKKSMIF